MKIPYVVAFLAATSTPAIAAPADSPTPSGSEIRLRDTSSGDNDTAPSNGQAYQVYGNPEECPEGTRFDKGLLLSPCYQVCVDINDPTKTQIVQRKKGSKCGQMLMWPIECSAEGLCMIV